MSEVTKNKYLPNKQTWIFSLSAFVLSLVLFLLFDNKNVSATVVFLASAKHSLISKVAKIGYLLGITFISYLSVSTCLLSNKCLMWYFGVLLFLLGLINSVIHYLTGSPLNTTHIAIALQNLHFTGMFLDFTSGVGLISITASAVFLYVLWLFRQKMGFKINSYFVLSLILISLAANVFYAIQTDFRRTPIYTYNVPIAVVRAVNSVKVAYVPREKVPLLSADTPTLDLVMLIIDESVNYEALVSYGSVISKTEELKIRMNAPVYFFKAHSAANHSAASNYVLRLGLDKSFYPDKDGITLNKPTIFSYAKAAGYKTVFYDAQSQPNRLQNFMSYFDLDDIDLFMTANPSTRRSQRDDEAIKRITSIIAEASSENKIMMMIVKNGVHFPYINNIPEYMLDDFPESCRSRGVSFSVTKKSCLKIQYETMLKHSVDIFFDSLLKMLHGKKAAIVYTSDHGQNLASKNKLPHGSSEDVSECEISVPILLIGHCFTDIKQNNEIKSHFQIPATLKSILGFSSQLDQRDITLWGEWENDSTFLRDLFDKNGRWFKTACDCEY